jgi:hypothetical protein
MLFLLPWDSDGSEGDRHRRGCCGLLLFVNGLAVLGDGIVYDWKLAAILIAAGVFIGSMVRRKCTNVNDHLSCE